METQQDDQQFCLRWNNFQANITSQFEALRDDEDFTDVTIACEGQKIQAHKVVLSACSPFFKELFKSNPCSHPIIFMRDVEARHIVALMEFMYAGEVNVAQAHLSTFLKTAESLKIRGLTDTSTETETPKDEDDTLYLNPQSSKSTPINNNNNNNNSSNNSKNKLKHNNQNQIPSSSSTVTSSQDISNSPPPIKKTKTSTDSTEEITKQLDVCKTVLHPKIELPDYLSDDDGKEDNQTNFFATGDVTELPGGMEIIPQLASFNMKDSGINETSPNGNLRLRKRRSSEHWPPFDYSHQTENFGEAPDSPVYSNDRKEGDKKNRLIKLGEGIEIYEDQLRSVKWNDYRKLTRGLATILFSPAELATCSVTGQRWSRAGSGERPVKPALDRLKVQALISYVATRFPTVEISRIKQVLAYKCKENSTAFKMKAVRYYEDQQSK